MKLNNFCHPKNPCWTTLWGFSPKYPRERLENSETFDKKLISQAKSRNFCHFLINRRLLHNILGGKFVEIHAKITCFLQKSSKSIQKTPVPDLLRS